MVSTVGYAARELRGELTSCHMQPHREEHTSAFDAASLACCSCNLSCAMVCDSNSCNEEA